MHLSSVLLFLTFGVLATYCAEGGDWCYSGCAHTPSHWADDYVSCGGKKQSPININTLHVKKDENLANFTFKNFSSHVLDKVEITDHTVKFDLHAGVEVSGGGLNDVYSTAQFHFHWGSTDHHPGSEHLVNGYRYPMEMHIVSLKKGLDVGQAKETPEGIAVLGFFINATDDDDTSGPWGNLTSYLMNTTGTISNLIETISINDLIGNVDLQKFYRYSGSLTTPTCNEAVVWTVFQEPINVNKMLIQRFPEKTGLTNVYRPTQALNGRQVYASAAASLPSYSWCYDDGHCDYKPSKWHYMPNSHCGEKRQSPINIVPTKAVENKQLNAFTFKNFDNKHALKYISNSGHSVKCKLKEDMVEVSGGGLGHVYSTLQFHFHWGNASFHSQGSEHTMDSKRYPMEMHIVNKRKDLTLEEAIKTPNGLAVLGFFIEATDITKSGGASGHQETGSTSHMEPWKNFTKYLSGVEHTHSNMTIKDEISIDDLLGSVSRTSYYRYNGSLTTPGCNEAVVWTVFKESVKVDQSLIRMFPVKTGLTNVYRPPQPLNERHVYASPAAIVPSHSWCYDGSHCEYSPSKWHDLPGAHCGKSRQSPINIVSTKAIKNNLLDDFTFKNFDNKHALKYIINSGHSVKCILEEDMVEVSGGGLGHVYTTLQFHFHWGKASSKSEGSEHTMDSKRYPMEMHIVNKRKDLTLEKAVQTPNGLAVLGFFIEAPATSKSSSGSEHQDTSSTSNMESWKNLTKYLSDIIHIGSNMTVKDEFSIDDLLGNVNRSLYYRYNGSLTTPGCNEAVVWTVFKESVKVDQSLMEKFPKDIGYDNVYRPVQNLHGRTIYTSAASSVSAPVVLVQLLVCLTNLHL